MTMSESLKPSSGIGKRVLSAAILAPIIIGFIIHGGVPFIFLMVAAFLIALAEWYRMVVRLPRPALHILLGALYLACCIMSFILLRLEMPLGAYWALTMMVTLWASDSGAYFTGRKFGGPKLAPVISPKKTWSGFGGALLSAGIMLFLFYYIFFSHHAIFRVGTVSGRPLEFFLTGVIIGGIGQAGDLLESWFKRRAGVKDTGNLIPGHGGLLDRIDSLLLASPVFLALAWLWLR